LIAQAKLAGPWIGQSQNLNVHYSISDQPMSEEEWTRTFVTEH
jgi:hypothetical protein